MDFAIWRQSCSERRCQCMANRLLNCLPTRMMGPAGEEHAMRLTWFREVVKCLMRRLLGFVFPWCCACKKLVSEVEPESTGKRDQCCLSTAFARCRTPCEIFCPWPLAVLYIPYNSYVVQSLIKQSSNSYPSVSYMWRLLVCSLCFRGFLWGRGCFIVKVCDLTL